MFIDWFDTKDLTIAISCDNHVHVLNLIFSLFGSWGSLVGKSVLSLTWYPSWFQYSISHAIKIVLQPIWCWFSGGHDIKVFMISDYAVYVF